MVNSNCLKKKKKILVQKGGFLPFVLPLVGKAFSLLL